MKTKLKLHVLLLVLLCAANFARGQGTAFTYHGQLNLNGSPVSGAHDLQFTVYDADAAGLVVGGPIAVNAVDVINGVFTARIDFGDGVFTGPPRWLQIGVRPAGNGNFTTLSPRQELTSSPYSIRAQSAGIAADVSNGSVVKSLNTLKDNVTLAAGNNVTLTPNGNTLTIAAANGGGSSIWSQLNNNAYYNLGRVGIGTSTPSGALHVASGGFAVTGASSPYTGAGAGIFMEWGGTVGNVFAFDYGSFSSRPLVLNSPGGNVGIGTATPATKLTVRSGSSVFSGYGIEHTDGTVRLTTFIDGSSGWFGTRSNHPLNFFINDGLPAITIDGGGTTIVSGLGSFIVGSPNAESGASIKRGNNRADVRFNGSTLKLVAATGSGPPPSTFGIAIDTAGNVGLGTESPVAKLDVRGTTRTCVLTITGGCDLAEPFPMDANTAPKGSVMVIDNENPGRLKLSARPYDTRVAGIVSGANGINPGISLQQEGISDDGQNVALSGRVYVQADASNGAIRPGDLLTTSDTPGHAMKVTDHAKAQGAILGKAMSGLETGKGTVLVLVTLQ